VILLLESLNNHLDFDHEADGSLPPDFGPKKPAVALSLLRSLAGPAPSPPPSHFLDPPVFSRTLKSSV